MSIPDSPFLFSNRRLAAIAKARGRRKCRGMTRHGTKKRSTFGQGESDRTAFHAGIWHLSAGRSPKRQHRVLKLSQGYSLFP
jgi:hypothetical protein